MDKTYVKLRDTGSVFHDTANQITITGTKPAYVPMSDRVKKGLKGGALEKISEAEYNKLMKAWEADHGTPDTAEEAAKAQEDSAMGKSNKSGKGKDTDNGEGDDEVELVDDKMTKDELIEKCIELDIEYDDKDVKADLIAKINKELKKKK